jgi:hypothetical protein
MADIRGVGPGAAMAHWVRSCFEGLGESSELWSFSVGISLHDFRILCPAEYFMYTCQ